jgi:hypothetical protein
VALPQPVIDLFNLSLAALRHLAKEAEVKVAAGATKAELISALSEKVDPGVLQQRAADLLYAGNTSITWVRLGPSASSDGDSEAAVVGVAATEPGGGFAVDEFRTALTDFVGADPFNIELRPPVTGTPAVVEAQEWSSDKILLTFVVRKRIQTVIHNFELRQVFADQFFQVVVRPSDGIFEIRTNHTRARNLERTWLAEFAERLDRSVGYRAITQPEFDRLRAELGGVIDVYKGKEEAGLLPYDTIELSKKDTIADLAGNERFISDTETLQPVSEDILFTAEGIGQIRLRMSANGSVWFRTVVSEAVIDLVYEKLRGIGAL